MTRERVADSAIAMPLRLAGAVWGHLVGDAMGVAYEFLRPDAIGEVRWGRPGGMWNQPPGTWSDDGALMLALLDSLTSVGFDPEDQGRRALAWYAEGAYTPDGDGRFDIGNATRAALQAIEGGSRAEEAGPTHDRSASNGSLMRILPIALWGHAQRLTGGELTDLAARASKVTHGHPVAQVACAVYVNVASEMLREAEPAPALESAVDNARTCFGAGGTAADTDLAEALEELVAWPSSHMPEGRGGALNGFWSAWAAFEGATSYQDAIERAIGFGNDTDTTAAIAGGLAGIRWGLDGIPAEWLAGMRGREIVDPLIDRLLEANGWRTSSSHPLRVDWVDLETVPGLRGAPGRLGMTFLPGKEYISPWSGAWWRDLERDLARLREHHGCDLFLLLVEDHELDLTRTTGLPAAFERHGIELRRHPVVDMNVPADRNAYRATIEGLTAAIRAGKSVVVACRGGLGRTGTAVACLLVEEGLEPGDAIGLTRASRRHTIERELQEDWVRDWRGPLTRSNALGHRLRTLLALVACLAVAGCGSIAAPGSSSSASEPAATFFDVSPEGVTEPARVVRVVDGDTIIVDRGQGRETVRYIGIDTPESVRPSFPIEWMGPEASAENARLVGGADVLLERDVSEFDRFGRLLRYVWIADARAPSGWVLVNLELVARGYAQLLTMPPDVRYAVLFRQAQRQARDQGLGLWGPH